MCSYQTIPDMYPRYLDSLVANISDDAQCQQQCTNNRAFACRAYSFYASGSQCFISSDDRSIFQFQLVKKKFNFNNLKKKFISFSWAVCSVESTWNELHGTEL